MSCNKIHMYGGKEFLKIIRKPRNKVTKSAGFNSGFIKYSQKREISISYRYYCNTCEKKTLQKQTEPALKGELFDEAKAIIIKTIIITFSGCIVASVLLGILDACS